MCVFPAKMIKQQRKCEVAFAYSPLNEDELPLNVGETVVILREVRAEAALRVQSLCVVFREP